MHVAISWHRRIHAYQMEILSAKHRLHRMHRADRMLHFANGPPLEGKHEQPKSKRYFLAALKPNEQRYRLQRSRNPIVDESLPASIATATGNEAKYCLKPIHAAAIYEPSERRRNAEIGCILKAICAIIEHGIEDGA